MILDGVSYSDYTLLVVSYNAYIIVPFSQSSKIFSGLFWSSMDVRCVSPPMLYF